MRNIKILVDALSQWSKRYRNFGDYSVTTLLKPPRMVQLSRRYADKVQRDPAQQIAAFIGTGVHGMFEECLKMQAVLEPDYDIERTVYDKIEDRLIAGKFDILWQGKHLYDIKTCKTWKKVFDPGMEEWHQQLNIYAYLLHNRGLDVRSINVIACYLDWQQQKSFRNDEYPTAPVVEYELTLWDWANTEEFLRKRIRLMKESEEVEDGSLPLCSDEEMWVRNKDINYAVLAATNAGRALKVCLSFEEAALYAQSSKSIKHGVSFIEVRKPERKRCETWCDGKMFCNEYTKYAAKKEAGNYYEKVML